MRRALAIVGVFVAVSYVWLIPGFPYDFGFDWVTANAFTDGRDPYLKISDLAGHYGRASSAGYHPRTAGALIILSPAGLLSVDHFYIAGRTVTVLGAVWLAWVTAKVGSWDPRFGWTLLPAVLLVDPFATVLEVSQSDFLVAALIGNTLLLERRKVLWSGVPLGIAVCLKMWPWMLVPALMATRRWRAAIGATATFAGLNLFGLAFPHVTLEGMIRAMKSTWDSFSWARNPIIGDLPVALPIIIGLVAIWLLRRQHWEKVYVYAIPLALLAAPLLWTTYLVSLVIPVAWMLAAHSSRIPNDDVPTRDHEHEGGSPSTGQT